MLGNFSAFSFLPHPIFALQGGYQLTYGHLLAIAATILITALNYLGVRKAGNFQLVMTTLKIVMIVVIIAAGFSATSGSWSNFGTTFLGAKGGMAGFMAALVARSGPMTAGTISTWSAARFAILSEAFPSR